MLNAHKENNIIMLHVHVVPLKNGILMKNAFIKIMLLVQLLELLLVV
mgnify:CR=1 FL=1